jgi:hypothetical protein
VELAFEELQAEHQVRLTLEIRTSGVGLAKGMGLMVAIVALQTSAGGTKGGVRKLVRTWPSYHNRTMPGMVLSLLHELGNSLSGQAIEHRKQSKIGSYLAG